MLGWVPFNTKFSYCLGKEACISTGVSKSTAAYLLFLALAKCQSSKLVVVDLDIYGPSIPKMLGVEK